MGARALWCLNGACEIAQPIGLTLGLMISTDTILKEANRDPIFTPFVARLAYPGPVGRMVRRGGSLNPILPEKGKPTARQMLDNHLALIKQNNIELEGIKKAMGSIDNFTGGLSEEDASGLRTQTDPFG